ncbi:MAG: glutathione S-transferase family protein [Chroococcidiopsidaceae cyanobacterium CP_BM_RX_35]|nr:glutathione S-transferase family protein [Chroococcidiopsidaceae cyanobacterium CP_BM_RX_35]
MIALYDFTLSGNCYKVRLMLALLGLKYKVIPVNLQAGEHKSTEFLKRHPFGKVPVLVDGDTVIWDSQAILVYLARKYGEDWLPSHPELMGKIMQWLSVAAQSIAESLAAARRHFLLNAQEDIDAAQKKAYELLGVFENHLGDRHWLECDHPTIADIACFPYIALAAEGKISLDAYPSVIAWVERVKQYPGYVGMPGLS